MNETDNAVQSIIVLHWHYKKGNAFSGQTFVKEKKPASKQIHWYTSCNAHDWATLPAA